MKKGQKKAEISKKIKTLDKNASAQKMEALKKAYAEAANDPELKELINDWRITDCEGWE